MAPPGFPHLLTAPLSHPTSCLLFDLFRFTDLESCHPASPPICPLSSFIFPLSRPSSRPSFGLPRISNPALPVVPRRSPRECSSRRGRFRSPSQSFLVVFSV